MATTAVENLFPPFPGDTITVFGAYLAGRGILAWPMVYLFTVTGNMASNLFLFYLGRGRGRNFIKNHPRLFHPELIPRVGLFYRRWGAGLIFGSRFLVGMRSIVPLFAGVTHLRPRKFLVPITVSILLQHALLIFLGHSVGKNWEEILQLVKNVNLGLGLVAAVLVVLAVFWYRKLNRYLKHELETTDENIGDSLK
ncbi:MAG: DedA family protein [Gemmatimonadota bacterium]|nr:DedA family protein [Gemmatimonadota bacterium]